MGPYTRRMATIKHKAFSQEETDRQKVAYPKVFERGESLIRTIPGYVTVPLAFEKFQDRIKNWKVRYDDVYVLTFPKSGTTWTQELVWLLQNDFNYEEAKAVILDNRSPYLEFPIYVQPGKEDMSSLQRGDYLNSVEEMPSPRLLKSHFRLCLLPDDLLEKSKVVICLRNPKDTVVSYYHHEKRFINYSYAGDFQAFFDDFMDNLIRRCSYFEHIADLWQQRNRPNVCLLFFEDMKRDLSTCVKKVAKFLGKSVTDDMVSTLVEHLSFAKMRNNPAVNQEHGISKYLYNSSEVLFMRKGEIGDWKNYFTDEMNRRMDEAIEKHFKPIGLEFQYE